MSHTFEGPSKKTRFHYNSDLSGDVSIHVDDENGLRALNVPGEDLLAFVADYVRGRKISALEDAEWHEVFGIENELSGRKDGGEAGWD